MFSTNRYFLSVFLFASMTLALASCKKYTPKTVNNRTVQFELFTDQEFKGLRNEISFTLFIEHQGSAPIWDTVLPPMTLEDIPFLPKKLVILKTISGDNSILKAGFRYHLLEVGNSASIDTISPNTAFKIIAFNFH